MSLPSTSRKELKRPDAFVVQTSSFFKSLHENIMLVLLCLGIVFLIAVGAIYYNSAKMAKAEQALGLFYTTKQGLEKALEKNTKTDPAWETKVKAELEQMQNIPNKFKGTLASYQAMLLLGNLYLDRSNSLKAVEYFEKAVAAAGHLQKLKPIALYSLAYAYENSSKYDAAIETLAKILNTTEGKAWRGEALLAAARNYALKGDVKKAIEQYDLVSLELPNTPFAQTARVQKGHLH